MNKKTLITVVLLAFGVLAATLFFGGNKDSNNEILGGEVQSGEVVIEMRQDGYTPDEITIEKGTTVRFVNKDDGPRWPASDLHPSHGIYPEFDPKEPVPVGEEWSFTFNKVGEWTMHDHLAPYISGYITVVE